MNIDNSRTKVLFVVSSFGYGGIESFIVNYTNRLDKSKFQIDVYALNSAGPPYTSLIESRGGNVYFDGEIYTATRNLYFINKWIKFMRQGNYDVVHANCNFVNGLILFAAKISGVPIRLSHSHLTKLFSDSLAQNLYALLRRIMVNIFATKKLGCGTMACESMYGRKASFDVIKNGIDVKHFLTINLDAIKLIREELNIHEGQKVYMNISRICKQKNQPFIIDIFNEIQKREINSVLIIGGASPDMDPTSINDNSDALYKQKITEYGLEKKVIIVGPRTDMNELYHLSDCWIFPSLFEGLPISLLELQAASVPVVVSESITKEADMGLGLLEFIPLENSAVKWAEIAISKTKKTLDNQIVYSSFKKHNLDISQNVSKLEKIYLGID